MRVLCVHPGGIRTRIAQQARLGDISSVAGSAAELHANFEHAARTSAADAAAAIVRAIERKPTRLLIGIDVRLGDWVFLLVPARASTWFSGLARWQRQRLKR